MPMARLLVCALSSTDLLACDRCFIRLGHLMLFPLRSSLYICLPRELGGVGAGATLVREKGQVSEGTQVSISSGLRIVQGWG